MESVITKPWNCEARKHESESKFVKKGSKSIKGKCHPKSHKSVFTNSKSCNASCYVSVKLYDSISEMLQVGKRAEVQVFLQIRIFRQLICYYLSQSFTDLGKTSKEVIDKILVIRHGTENG